MLPGQFRARALQQHAHRTRPAARGLLVRLRRRVGGTRWGLNALRKPTCTAQARAVMFNTLSKLSYRDSTRHRLLEMQSLKERVLLIHTTHLCQIRTLNPNPNVSEKRTQVKAQRTILGPWRTPRSRSLAACSHLRCRERSPLLQTKGEEDSAEGIPPPKRNICLSHRSLSGARARGTDRSGP